MPLPPLSVAYRVQSRAAGQDASTQGMELRFALPWSLTGLAFFDAGQVWARPRDASFDLAKSIGLGLRASTPVGLLRLDAAYPPGASHHHKIVVVDDCLAFCGGIDMTSNRWDTPAHLDDDPRRIGPTGQAYGAWHDTIMAVEGPAATAVGELARERCHHDAAAAAQRLNPANQSCPLKVEGKDVPSVTVLIHALYGNHGGQFSRTSDFEVETKPAWQPA